MDNTILTLDRLLAKGEDAVLATVIGHTGSTPRGAGTKMVVRADGRIAGTIGGGLVESEAIKTALEVFTQKSAVIRSFDLKVSGALDSLDMLCGGHMTVLLEWVPADPANRRLYQAMCGEMATGKKAVLVGLLPENDAGQAPLQRFLITGNGTVPDSPAVPVDQLDALLTAASSSRGTKVLTVGTRRFLVDPIVQTGTVFIFGAGHVSLQLARLTHMVEFRTVVLDDRAVFANSDRFETADQIHVLDDFASAFRELAVDPDSYVVIITRGHSHDKAVLAQALKTSAGYIGMIGSRKKRDAIYASLLDEGFTAKDLDRVHSPIGLSIGGQTPEEIAVSIVAELIAKRAGTDRPPA